MKANSRAEKRNITSYALWIDIIWIIIIMVLSVGIRLSPIVLKDYSKSYDTLYADESDHPYTSDPGDAYYYARRINDFADGKYALQPFDRSDSDAKMIKISEERDAELKRNLFPIIGAFFLKVGSLFGVTDVMAVGTIYISLLVGMAAVLIYIFIKNRTNRCAGVAAAVLLSCGIPVLINTNWGQIDTDAILILLPVAMMLSFYKSLESDNPKGKIIWSIASCFSYVCICFSWTSYNVYYIVFCGVALVVLIGSLIFKGVFPKKIRLVILAQIIFNTLFSLVVDGKTFFTDMAALFSSSSGVIGTGAAGYPSASKYISELFDLSWFTTGFRQLFDTSIHTNINMLGGLGVVVVVLFTSILLIVVCFISLRKDSFLLSRFPNMNTIGLQTMIFVPWIAATCIMLTQGQRFLEMMLIPVTILFGLGFGYITDFIHDRGINGKDSERTGIRKKAIYAFIYNRKIRYAIVILLTSAFIIMPLYGACKESKSYNPQITDIYYDTADWIKKNTEEDAIVAGWWDYGYFYQLYADRTAIAHGGTYDGQFFYWLGRALMTSDYELSAGIFRMLGNGGLRAQGILTGIMNEPENECEALCRILTVPREEAKRILMDEYNIPGDRADDVTRLTHPIDPRPIYLAITQDMFIKHYAIAYYGNWKFGSDNNSNGFYYANTLTSKSVKKGGEAKAEILGNRTNIRSITYLVDEYGNLSYHVYNDEKQEAAFGRCLIIENEKVISDQILGENKDTLVIFKEGDLYCAICCNSDFCDSVMFKLFFTDAAEQSTYKKVFTTEVSEELFADKSMIQHMIYCPGLKNYLGSAGVYKID